MRFRGLRARLLDTRAAVERRDAADHLCRGPQRSAGPGDGAGPVGLRAWARMSPKPAAFSALRKAWSKSSARERVRDTPISEATFCGAGVGAAIAGMRPVVEVQIFDFVTFMMDMIVNQAAKFRFMNGGDAERADRRSAVRRAAASGSPRSTARASRPGSRTYAGPCRRGALDAVRREGSAHRRDPRRQPSDFSRA